MINITARGFELKQGAKDGIEKELKRIEKMLPENATFDVTLKKEKEGYKCDITVKHFGSFIRGEAFEAKIEPVIDAAVDDLKRKIRKLKTLFVDKKRKGNFEELAYAFEELELDDDISMYNFDEAYEGTADIRRTKKITPNMMTDDEAAFQMEMLGHSFFVYLGIDGETKIIYKRKSGYGVLICE
ncbi:MAG: ribosome-associated translation inhibitor RaiA [Eubacterium sp.]|nr:ribosome-associated translation inhibitor RaiA [Eubacterium sp.]